MRLILVALGVAAAALAVSYGTVTRFAGQPASLKDTGAVVSETLADVLGNSSGRPVGKLFMEVARDRAAGSGDPPAGGDAAPEPLGKTAGSPGSPAKEVKKKTAAVLKADVPVALPPAVAVSSSLPLSFADGFPAGTAGHAPPAKAVAPEEVSHKECGFAAGKNPTHLVLLDEIAWMGSPAHGGEDGSGGAQGEWLELKNNAGVDVDLTGWRIVNKSGKFKIDFDSGDFLAEGARFLLERSDDATVPDVPADKLYAGVLQNGGDWLQLLNAQCVLVDEVDASRGWPAGENAAKKTMERSAIDLSWNTSGAPGGTPKLENSTFSMRNTPPLHAGAASPPPPPAAAPAQTPPAATSTATSTGVAVEESSSTPTSTPPTAPAVNHVVIAELQITGGTGLSGNDFIKLHNPTASAVDVSGWKLRKRAQTGSESSVRVFASGHAIAAGGYFIWANSSDGFALSLGANESSTQTIASNNSIAFLNSDGVLIDALAWGEGHVNPFVEAGVYPTNPEGGQRLTRKSVSGAVQDTDNNAADFAIQ